MGDCPGAVEKQQPDRPYGHRNTKRQVVDDQKAEGNGQQKRRHGPHTNQHNPDTSNIGLLDRETDTTRNIGRSGRQNAAPQRNMRREERVTVQGPVTKQQPDGMSHRGGGGSVFKNGAVPEGIVHCSVFFGV